MTDPPRPEMVMWHQVGEPSPVYATICCGYTEQELTQFRDGDVLTTDPGRVTCTLRHKSTDERGQL